MNKGKGKVRFNFDVHVKGATGTMLVNISTSPYLSRLFFRVCEDSKLLVQFLDTCHAERSRQKGTNKGKTLDLENIVKRPQEMKVPGSRAFRLTFMFEYSSLLLT